jgi:hypothetical protein
MSLHYFHFENGITALDSVGVNLLDLKAVRLEAVGTMAEIFRDGDVGTLWEGKPMRLWVTDQPDGLGQTLFTLHITATGDH